MDTRNITSPKPAASHTPSPDENAALQAKLKASIDNVFAALSSTSHIPEGGLLIEDPDNGWLGFLRRRSAMGQLCRCKQYADSVYDSFKELLNNHPEWAVRAEVVALVEHYSVVVVDLNVFRTQSRLNRSQCRGVKKRARDVLAAVQVTTTAARSQQLLQLVQEELKKKQNLESISPPNSCMSTPRKVHHQELYEDTSHIPAKFIYGVGTDPGSSSWAPPDEIPLLSRISSIDDGRILFMESVPDLPERSDNEDNSSVIPLLPGPSSEN